MGHNIYADRFYGFRNPAWHELGFVTDEAMSAEDVYERLGHYWFEKVPTWAEINGKPQEVGYAIVRSATKEDANERYMGSATSRYNLLQPAEAVELFDLKVGQPVETMGMLGKGERMFLTWTMPSFDVGSLSDDEVQTFGFLALGFNGKIGAQLSVVTIRVVCQNTWNAAISQAENSKGDGKTGLLFTGKHTMKDLNYRLGEWMGYVQENAENEVRLLKEFFGKLASTPVKSEKEVHEILWEAYPNKKKISGYYPETLLEGDNERIDDANEIQEQYRDGIYELFSGAGTDITNDYWGLFNAGTEYFNWGQMAKKPVDASIMVGNRNGNMGKLAKVLASRVG